MPFKTFSARALTIGYTIALLLIAGLSLVSHVALEYGLQSNEGSAAIINKSGRQRMLSQRIASLSAQYRSGDPSVHDDLTSAINEFEAANDFLVTASRSAKSGSENAQELKTLYFASENSLDSQVQRFVADARKVAGLPPGHATSDPLLSRIFADSRTPLLTGLNTVVLIEQRQSEQRITNLEYMQWAIFATVLVTLLVEALVIFKPMIRRIITHTSDLLHFATTDGLTELANRRSFIERCETEIMRVRRHNRPASFLMIDIDHFKAINDTYGHAAGDKVLAAVGGALRQTLRQIDICGRLGGEEFAVLLIETALPEAAITAERIRDWFAAMTVDYLGQSIKFTVSIGCTSINGSVAGVDDVMSVADHLMYQAKQTGRNRVVVTPAVI